MLKILFSVIKEKFRLLITQKSIKRNKIQQWKLKFEWNEKIYKNMKGKVIALLALMALCVNKCNSSAIPMWEFLSRDEKVSVRVRNVVKTLWFVIRMTWFWWTTEMFTIKKKNDFKMFISIFLKKMNSHLREKPSRSSFYTGRMLALRQKKIVMVKRKLKIV